ncbi:diaminopimelate epimerase [Alicyclobacillus hesperidum subsp. aegles]|uniref:diaminopimelate epimerase n=1 Tax=Alicyclobacillus hesperidum TaxID=89784 RepID=UPI0007193B1D|nr:diaminopimelate epimerase [Alicyclobacillus hesperidum]KRW92060.1 diaminopimelate epimerase [Alicyclobacillus tengchongensis]GLG00856.1 diaminopimelate epimerase [Alicyclobacillus hesperidum subsp. aegles]
MRFTKMHALGNNYIYVSTAETQLPSLDLAELARRVSDVRRGIGSDGLIVIQPSDVADVGMRIWNADGSEAESCGNGLRCVAKYAYEHGLVDTGVFSIETKAGVVEARVHMDRHGRVPLVTIDMGQAGFGSSVVPYTGVHRGDDVAVDIDGVPVWGTLVSVGNPHFVSLVDRVDDEEVLRIGPRIESHPDFPERINAEFVAVKSPSEIDFRVYERGSGVTYACGTGACASVAALAHKGLVGSKVTVHLLGGDLDIELRDDGHILMTGEAVTVCEGDYFV